MKVNRSRCRLLFLGGLHLDSPQFNFFFFFLHVGQQTTGHEVESLEYSPYTQIFFRTCNTSPKNHTICITDMSLQESQFNLLERSTCFAVDNLQ